MDFSPFYPLKGYPLVRYLVWRQSVIVYDAVTDAWRVQNSVMVFHMQHQRTTIVGEFQGLVPLRIQSFVHDLQGKEKYGKMSQESYSLQY